MFFFSRFALNFIISYHKLYFAYIYSTIIGWLVILVIKLSSEILRFVMALMYACMYIKSVCMCVSVCVCAWVLTQPNGVCLSYTPLIS